MSDPYVNFEPTPEQVAAFHEWLAERPDPVRAVAERFPPWKVFRLKPTGQHLRTLAFATEDDGRVTVRAHCWRPELPGILDRQVFGLDPNDFEEIE